MGKIEWYKIVTFKKGSEKKWKPIWKDNLSSRYSSKMMFLKTICNFDDLSVDRIFPITTSVCYLRDLSLLKLYIFI